MADQPFRLFVLNPFRHRTHFHQCTNKQRRVGLAAVIAALGLGLTGFLAPAPQVLAQKPTQAKVIRIGVSKFGSVLNYIYARKVLDPILAKRGVTVEWKQFVAGPQLMEALAVGSIDFTFTGEPPPIFAQAAGTPVVYVANERLGPAAVAVLVPRGSKLRSAADLKGKRVAITKATNSQYIINEGLRRVGLNPKQIIPVYLTPAEGRSAFEAGKVEAWSTWDPFQAAAEKSSGARVLYDGKGIQPNTGYYLSTRSFANANRSTLLAMLKVIDETNTFASRNPKAVAEVLSPRYGLPVDVLEAVEKRRQHGLQPIDARVIAGQQQVADGFYREKLLPQRVKVADAVWRP
jgi:sulfonate transport system substrate-binding protein